MSEKKELGAAIEEMETELDMDAEIKRASDVTVRLSKPMNYEGKTYTKLELDFNGMTGRDMEAIDDELQALGVIIANPTLSHKYQRILAARAAGVPSDMLEHLPLRDYQKVTNAVRRFLLATA
ncbi:MAG: phage tail assembly protein [Clostridiales bacterium]|nr:phage tail assembly protein [Clostridiales bacterium]